MTKIHNRCAFYKKEGTRKENKLQCKICNESREVRREEFRARNCVLGSKKIKIKEIKKKKKNHSKMRVFP